MNIALYLKSEAGDDYVYLLLDKTIDQIEERIRSDFDFIAPFCNYKVGTEGDLTLKETESLRLLLNKLLRESYE